MKNKLQTEMVIAKMHLHEIFTACGFKPYLQILDNVCIESPKQKIHQREVIFQLVLLHLYYTNVDNYVISNFRDHLVGGYPARTQPSPCTCDVILSIKESPPSICCTYSSWTQYYWWKISSTVHLATIKLFNTPGNKCDCL